MLLATRPELGVDHACDVRHHATCRQDVALVREQEAGHLDGTYPLDEVAFLVVRVVEGFVYVERITGERPDPDRAASALHFLLR